MFNRTVREFLERNGINPEEVRDKVNCDILSMGSVSKIFEEFGIYKSEERRKVCIANIIGYDYRCRGIYPDAYSSLNHFFDDSTNNGYKKRSCKDLKKTPEEMLASPSFVTEPVGLFNLDPEGGIYVISHNGLHRYSALRALFLAELYKHPENIEQIKEKYTIEAMVEDIDKIKTYCNFIIIRAYPNKWLKSEWVDGVRTGRAVLEHENRERQILTDEELISYVSEIYTSKKELFDSVDNEDFKNFIKENLTTTLGRVGG